MTNNPQNCVAQHTNWDHHHEGHSGYLAINIANTNLPGWLASTKPDVVMFMLGTNDVFQGKSTADIIASFTKMVGQMRSVNANVKIIVSSAPTKTTRTPSLEGNQKTTTREWCREATVKLTRRGQQVDTVISSAISQAGITALNNAIPAWAKAQNTTASPIYIADVAASYPPGNTDLRDGVHPNDAGDVVIANVLAPLVTWVIKSSTPAQAKPVAFAA